MDPAGKIGGESFDIFGNVEKGQEMKRIPNTHRAFFSATNSLILCKFSTPADAAPGALCSKFLRNFKQARARRAEFKHKEKEPALRQADENPTRC